jgi:amino acid adenylation domain-containing protein
MQSLVEALENNPTTSALSLEVLPAEERWQVVKRFNATSTAYPRDKLVHQVFEQQVARSPNAVAVKADGVSLTYTELDYRANKMAALLRKHGMQPGEYVPILLPRSLSMVIAQIAVLKCGGAYVPLDPETPIQRLGFILKDCCALRIISKGVVQPEWIPASIDWVDFIASANMTDLIEEGGSHDTHALSPAYVMYTSGSTGAPKGVVVPHRAVLRLVMNSDYATLGPQDCITHCSNPAFDASTFEVWGALLNGGRLLVVSQAVVLSATRLRDLLIEEGATILWMTVGLLKQYQQTLAGAFSGLRYLITGGDVVDPEIAKGILSCHGPQQLLNAYGPTEGTTFSTTYRIARVEEAAASIPIGKPISNTTVYILNAKLQPVPVGGIGEIFIGGDGVALGYVNRAELTAERFLPDPFSVESQARMYKSGDLGRWRPDGMIEFLGRNDNQVKIRGFRIELGEIEAHIRSRPWVREAVVVVREDEPGEKRLVCYLISQEASDGGYGASVEALRETLREALPGYMVPSAIVVLQQFPLTANGKLDRRALPAPDAAAYAMRDYEAPQGEVEVVLAEIWQKLLRLDRIGRHDSFFELGGNSLIATRVVTHVGYRLGVELPIRTLFEKPVLLQVAKFISDTLSIDDMREAS